MVWSHYILFKCLLLVYDKGVTYLNQRTNGPVNAHLISGPRITTKHGNVEKQGLEMTLTFNTHFHLLNELSAATNFQATGCYSFLNIHCFPIEKPKLPNPTLS